MEDSQIVQSYWARYENAIKYTEQKYGNYSRTIAKNILASVEDAEECVNDTYINVWNTILPHSPTRLSTFLGKITRNIAFNRYKQNNAQKRGGSEIPEILDELSECIAGTENTEKEIEYKELVSIINSFVAEFLRKK